MLPTSEKLEAKIVSDPVAAKYAADRPALRIKAITGF